MLEGYDDYDDMELEEILAEEQDDIDFTVDDLCRDEIKVAIKKAQDDLYCVNADAYLVDIEKDSDAFRGKSEVDDQRDWRDEGEQAIAEERQGGSKIRK